MTQTIEAKARAKDGCQLFYRVHPQPGKPRLVLIHSLALDTSVWDGVVRDWRPNSKFSFTIAVATEVRSRPGPYTTLLFADDLAAILDHAKWPAASVAGCSMGGCVTQAFAAAYPQRAQALGLIDTTPRMDQLLPLIGRSAPPKLPNRDSKAWSAFR